MGERSSTTPLASLSNGLYRMRLYSRSAVNQSRYNDATRMEIDEEGQPMEVVDEEEIDGGGRLFESNKKLSFYIIDGGKHMLQRIGDEVPFKRACEAIFEQILRIGCSSSTGLHHMLSVIVSNTASSHPDSGIVQHFHEVLPLEFVSGEAAVVMKELAASDDMKCTFDKKFGGHATSDLSQIVYYIRKMAKRRARSSRQLAVYFITANARPFGEGATARAMMASALKHLYDLREIDGGEFTCLYIGKEKDLRESDSLRKLDPNFAPEAIDELENVVYQKAFAARPSVILPFQIAPGVQFDVGLFTLAAVAKRPTPKWVDAEYERPVQSRTIYRTKDAVAMKKEELPSTAGTQSSQNDPGVKPFVLEATDRTRSELKHAIELGGERIIFSQQELARLRRFKKGIVLLGFQKFSELKMYLHVEAPKFIYPNEKTTAGSRRLFRALLEQCTATSQMMLCYLNSATHTSPRLVALVPSKNSDTSCDGFHVVRLPLVGDLLDGSDLYTRRMELEETEEQRSAVRLLLKKLTADYEPHENPSLQKFYSMLIEYAAGEVKEVEDTIKPYFSCAQAVDRVRPALDAVQDAFGDLSEAGKRKSAGKRAAAPEEEEPLRKIGIGDLEKAAKTGQLAMWIVTALRDVAVESGIPLEGARRKFEYIKAIEKHFGISKGA